MIFHVLNRGNARERIFHKEADFLAFEKVMAETMEQVPMRMLAYCGSARGRCARTSEFAPDLPPKRRQAAPTRPKSKSR
jgi:hypothetical protein